MRAESIVIQCIDRVFDTLGPNVRRSLIYHLRREFGVKRYEIPQKPTEFIKALRYVFGESAQKIEAEILKTIELELNLKPEGREDLLTLLNELKMKSIEEGLATHHTGIVKEERSETARKSRWLSEDHDYLYETE